MSAITGDSSGLPDQGLPGDVRLMNGVATAVFVLFGVALLGAAVAWAGRTPLWPIRAIQVDGELARNNVSTLRANVTPRLSGNFLSVDLQKTRSAFEAVPWVRQAVVKRVWPDRLAVRLSEHRAVALWQGSEGAERLVNAQGEVFEANVGDVEDEALPTFAGPNGSAAHLLAMYQALRPLVQRLDAEVSVLRLSGRGSWRVELDNAAVLELGRGSDAEVLERTERFVRTLAQVLYRYPAPLEYADLRHTSGYALRLRGITTVTDSPATKK